MKIIINSKSMSVYYKETSLNNFYRPLKTSILNEFYKGAVIMIMIIHIIFRKIKTLESFLTFRIINNIV